MRTSVITLTTAAVLTAGLLTAGGPSSAGAPGTAAAAAAAGAADPASARTTLSARCLDAGTELSVEEQRLESRLPRNGNPALAQRKPFARQMIEGGGFEAFGPALVHRLCGTRSLRAAERLVERQGRSLWRQAVRRAQSTGPVAGSLPASDDRPLYWTRLQATAALRQWQPRFALSIDERDALVTRFDKAARGMGDLSFTPGRRVRRVLVSGFDPYTLDGGETGTGNDTVGNNIRHGNPSGAAALALDGTTYRSRGGKRQVIEAYTLPVNYTEFAAGYVEDTVGPHMGARPRRRLDASITVSQAVGSEFRLEQWNARYHGDYPGNDLSLPCPGVGPRDATPQIAVDNPGCNTAVPRRWGGTLGFELRRPPQWTTASLPVGAMIRANTGADVPRPPGDTWPDTSVAFGVIWHTSFREFTDCGSNQVTERNTPVPTDYPPTEPPTPPSADSCSYEGGGGNYLSNESAYRNTLLRDHLGRDIPAGHIHTPDMQHFDEGNRFGVSDDTFDAWRTSIVAQTVELVHVVGDRS